MQKHIPSVRLVSRLWYLLAIPPLSIGPCLGLMVWEFSRWTLAAELSAPGDMRGWTLISLIPVVAGLILGVTVPVVVEMRRSRQVREYLRGIAGHGATGALRYPIPHDGAPVRIEAPMARE